MKHYPSCLTSRRRSTWAASFSWASALAALGLLGCATPQPSKPAHSTSGASDDAVCNDLRAEIDRNRKAIREAPTLSNTPIIQQATEAKADNNINTLRTRYTELNCDRPTPPSGAAPNPDAEPTSSVPPVPSTPGRDGIPRQ